MSIDVASTFQTEPDLEFNERELARARSALAHFDASLPVQVAPIIKGTTAPELDGLTFESRDPNHWSQIVSSVASASSTTVTQAVDALVASQARWAATSQAERSDVIRNAAVLLRQRRYQALATLRRECGKTWREADAEFCEAVDFLELYAAAAENQVGSPALLQGAGERNRVVYSPRGVAAAIIPWNFPIAIGLGMTVGPLVMGNAVAIKPAEQTPSTGRFIAELLLDAGIPQGVIAMLPGDGAVGKALVEDPRVDTILFTGSRDVGLEIIRTAAVTQPGQRQIKKVVAEMGGKNCIIVDASADIDAAADAVLASGFAFAGQKCSAGSRVLVHESVAQEFIDNLTPKAREVRVGTADDDQNFVTGVIDREATERLSALRALAVKSGKLVAEASDAPPDTGNFVLPLVISDLPMDSSLLTEEIFGPIITIETYSDLNEALDRVDALPYALTGGIFSTSAEAIELAGQRSPVGNFYVNRKITGAYVGRQPFGGSRMSGIGIKAGSPEYVRQFINQRILCENTGAPHE
jgi:RHH-type proline utilization regulon transcriptional repressor/proline dehydrogenase/delta 1-pyrroline-5-carboxylate dehydrogenase